MAFKISFFNQKGGVGKSSLVLHVASGMAAAGGKVCIVDLDSQRSCLTFHKNCKNNTFDVLSSEDELKSSGKQYNVIIYDHSPDRSVENLPFAGVDLVVVPFQASTLDYMATVTALKTLEKRGQPILTVLNRFVKNREFSKEFVSKIKADHVVAERSIYNRSLSNFTTIYSLTGLSKFAHGASDAKKEINELINKIGEKIKKK